MEKYQKKFLVISMVAVLVMLISIVGIGYAAFQTGMEVNGSGTVVASSWKIKFANLTLVAPEGTAVQKTAPQISNDTGITNYKVSLTTPGDYISYTFDIVNDGTFNATLSNYVIKPPICTGTGDNKENDETNTCKNLTYTLVYSDTKAPVKQGDPLNAKSTKNVTLTLNYNIDTKVEELPTNNVDISNLDISMTYTQAK